MIHSFFPSDKFFGPDNMYFQQNRQNLEEGKINNLTNFYKHQCEQLQEQINNIEFQTQLQEGFFGDMRRGAGNMVTRLGRRLAGGAPVDDVVDPQIAIDTQNKENSRETHIVRTLEMLSPVFAFHKNKIPDAIAQHKKNSESSLYYNSSEVPDTGMPTTKKEFKQASKENASYNKSQGAQVVSKGHHSILGHLASMLKVSSDYAKQHPDNKPDVVIDPVHTGHGFAEPSRREGTIHFVDGFHPDASSGRTSASHPDHEAYHRWQSRSHNAHHPTAEALFGPNSGTYHVGEDFEHLLPAGGGKSGIRAVNAANRERYRERMQQINSLMNPQDSPAEWSVPGRMG
jgi:hypothetical protein